MCFGDNNSRVKIYLRTKDGKIKIRNFCQAKFHQEQKQEKQWLQLKMINWEFSQVLAKRGLLRDREVRETGK